jgi:23S rRNA (uracil1939-C5)-methyltransferase
MTAADEWLKVESLDLEAQGVAHNAEGKVVFIEGALPGEEVLVSVQRKKNNWEQAFLVALRHESSQRVTPGCRHFGTCGGCKMQHFHVGAQVATKQRALEDALWHLGKVKAERMLRPIEGPSWGYRYRARLSVRYVVKKERVLVGFHERKSSYVADMDSCEVLPPHVSAMLVPLRDLITGILKSFMFGLLIGAIACYRGLTVKGGAAGVGASTTSSVVTAITVVIAFDTLFNIVYIVFFP